MKRSYNLIKAWKMTMSCGSQGTYKKLAKDSDFSIFSSLPKRDEASRYGERIWINEQIENHVKQMRFNKKESFRVDSIDSGVFNSSTYFKTSIYSNRPTSLANFFRSIWTSEEKINTLDKEVCKKIFHTTAAIGIS